MKVKNENNNRARIIISGSFTQRFGLDMPPFSYLLVCLIISHLPNYKFEYIYLYTIRKDKSVTHKHARSSFIVFELQLFLQLPITTNLHFDKRVIYFHISLYTNDVNTEDFTIFNVIG